MTKICVKICLSEFFFFLQHFFFASFSHLSFLVSQGDGYIFSRNGSGLSWNVNKQQDHAALFVPLGF